MRLSVTVHAEAETYGYAIGQRLNVAGLGNVKGGTLTPSWPGWSTTA